MSNIAITNNDNGSVVHSEPVYKDETFDGATGGQATYAAGTILGRITASGKLIQYDSGAADGSQIPVAVLTVELVVDAAADFPIRPLIKGNVKTERLVIDGSAPGVGITDAVQDLLRTYAIIPISTDQLAQLDNQ